MALVTKSFLHLVNTEALFVLDGSGLVPQTTRWTGDARLAGLAGDHLALAATGNSGLSSGAFGFMVLMHGLIKPMGDCTMKLDAIRKYGYFCNGFGVNLWWCELLVKRMTTSAVGTVSHLGLGSFSFGLLAPFSFLGWSRG